ncbi:hypothetical protein D3C77_450570 [compost metagenome]
MHRAIPGSEHVDEVRRRAVAEIELLTADIDNPDVVAEQLLQLFFVPPARRRQRPGGWRNMAPEGLEHLPDEALWRPVRQADPPA